MLVRKPVESGHVLFDGGGDGRRRRWTVILRAFAAAIHRSISIHGAVDHPLIDCSCSDMHYSVVWLGSLF